MEAQLTSIHQTHRPEPVIALHCSGGNARQWRALAAELDSGYELNTPEHYGVNTGDTWQSGQDFTLADEAARSLRLIDDSKARVHLIGHSYGGSLALHIALARTDRIASIALYEPCAFHLLPQLGVIAADEQAEILRLSTSIENYVSAGDCRQAMTAFVDYWSGPGAWSSLKPEHTNSLVTWAPNAVLAFNALFKEESRLHRYRDLHVPVRLLQGDCSPAPVKAISNALLGILPDCQIDRLAGMGHMGPLTDADYVARLLAAHIGSHSTRDSEFANSALDQLPRNTNPILDNAA